MKKSSAILTASMKRLHGDEAILVVRNTVPGHGNPDNDNWEERYTAIRGYIVHTRVVRAHTCHR